MLAQNGLSGSPVSRTDVSVPHRQSDASTAATNSSYADRSLVLLLEEFLLLTRLMCRTVQLSFSHPILKHLDTASTAKLSALMTTALHHGWDNSETYH